MTDTSKTKPKTKRKTKSKKQKNKKKEIFGALAIGAALIAIVALIISSFSGVTHNIAKLDKDVANGIDVSHHNGKIDWETVAKEVDFAFIRVGYRGYTNGEIFLDKKAKANLKNASKAKIPIGVYFYSQAINEKEAEEEAEFLIKNIRGYDISLPVVIDFEYATSNGENVGRLSDASLSRNEITGIITSFCKRVKKSGYTPGVYASSYIFRFHLNVKKLSSDTMIWVADYNEKVTFHGDYDFWQYSKLGKCKGVSSKYVDKNYWYIEKEDYN